jgi:hypothetical protein
LIWGEDIKIPLSYTGYRSIGTLHPSTPPPRARGRRHLCVQNAHFHVVLAVHCRRTKTRPIGRSRVAGRSEGGMYGVHRDKKGGRRDLGTPEADAAGPPCVMLGRFVGWWPHRKSNGYRSRSTDTIHARPPRSAGRTACIPHGGGDAYHAQPSRRYISKGQYVNVGASGCSKGGAFRAAAARDRWAGSSPEDGKIQVPP